MKCPPQHPYLPPFEIRRFINVSRTSLKRWSNQGKIRRVVTPGGNYLYHRDDIHQLFASKNISSETEFQCRTSVCYARVSSEHQRGDLERQIEYLKKTYPEREILSDIGSGINFKRRGFQTLLERVYEGTINEVAVMYKDRLCRYGLEFVEWLFEKNNTKLVVLNKTTTGEGENKELADDLLRVVTVFVARNNGRRAGENRRRRKRQRGEEEIEAGRKRHEKAGVDEFNESDKCTRKEGETKTCIYKVFVIVLVDGGGFHHFTSFVFGK